jgi:hypothetical protein
MTTRLNRPVARKTGTEIRDGSKARALIVTLHDEFLTLRLAGRRQEEVINLEHAYFGAIKARVFRDKMVRAQAKAALKRAKR